ncbi:MAG: porin family protein [Cyclobacteriaceae bacterium]|jgi:hypothetical protein
MKKVLAVCAFVLFSASAFAQLSGGIRLGMNLANQKVSIDGESESGDMKIGVLGGLYLDAKLSERIGLQPELVFSSMGSRDQDFDVDLPFNYISVPVMLKYYASENINIQAGPQLGFLMSAKIDDGTNSLDIKDEFKGMDFGLAFGLGGDFGKFNAGARYYLGLSKNLEDTSGDASWKNNAIQLFIGYRLFGGE